MIRKLLTMQQPTIRELAIVIGKLVAAFPGCFYGRLHYRGLGHNKTIVLYKSKGDYDTPIELSDTAKQERGWWIENIDAADHPISHSQPDIVI